MEYRLLPVATLLAVWVAHGQTEAPVAMLRGLTALQSVASDPQGALFSGDSTGEIRHLVARNTAVPLASTGGSANGMAFDAGENLYVADTLRKAILKVTPWGEVSVFADRCGGAPLSRPSHVAATASGELFFTDSGTGRVCRTGAGGNAGVFAAGLNAPGGLAVSATTGEVFVATSDGKLWRIAANRKRRAPFAVLAGAGAPGGMALDGQGNLYVARDGGSAVSVFDRSGRALRDLPVPGARATDLAFGGASLTDLYVVEAASGVLYRIPALTRSQRLPWESDAPLAITEPVDGAVLNRHDGEAVEGGLRISVKGRSRQPGTVLVNGTAVPVRDGRFETHVVLRERETAIRAEAGRLRDAVTVLWDRDSYRRYRVSVDDNIWFLRDIARNAATYQSIFDNPFLAFWREMHRKYGAKVHFNLYYETAGFNLTQMPAKYRAEWKQNADWLHLTFHARANDPDRPYLHTTAERIRADYRLVTREIERFAGPEVLSPVTTVHWGAITRAGARALRQEGVRGMVAYFQTRDQLPDVCMYLPHAQWSYLSGRDYWKDTREDILMIRHDMVINLFPVPKIIPFLDELAADPHRSEVLELMIHEQYFYPDYRAYEPDYRERVETAIRWAAGRGYKPVFYAEGLAGASGGK